MSLLRFLSRSIRRWSFQEPLPPQGDPIELLRVLPWDVCRLLPALLDELCRLSEDEEADMLQRVGVGQASVPIPEYDQFRICERLHVPYAASYDQLGFMELPRLLEALSIEVEVQEAFNPS